MVLSPQHIAYVCISAFAGRVEWMSSVGGGVGRSPVSLTSPHTAPPGRRDSPLSSMELQAYGEGEQPKSTTPPNRMKLAGNVVWARLQIVH